MATIKDVAKLADVSFGTVSNVLNGKKVSPGKAKLVHEAIKELGYAPNVTARSLKTNRTMNVGVILPTIVDPEYSRLFTGIERVLAEKGYTASLYTTSEIPAHETQIVKTIFQQNWDGIILSTCQPENRLFFDELEASGVAFVLIEREITGRKYAFVGFNNSSSLYFETLQLLKAGCRQMVMLTGPLEYSNEREAIQGVSDAFQDMKLSSDEYLLSLETNFDRESAFKTLVAYLRKNGCPECIVSTSITILEGALQALRITKNLSTTGPKILSLGEDTWVDNYYPNTTIIPRQAIKVGEIAAELLVTAIINPHLHETMHQKIDNRSARQPFKPAATPAEGITVSAGTKPIRVLMLEGNASFATMSLLSDFIDTYSTPVEVECLSYEKLYEKITVEAGKDNYDVFQIDIPWMSDFIYDGMLENLDMYILNDPKVTSDFIPGVLESYSKYKDSYYALPYLFGTQILFYRKDLFENPELRLQFWEMYNSELNPPSNWTEFNAIARFFTQSFNPSSPVQYGTTLGGAFSSGAVCEFLPRMWAYEGKPIDTYGRVSLYSPETVRALENYAESFRYASPPAMDSWWDEQVNEFSNGRAAMMIMFVAHVTNIVDRSRSKVVGKIGYAPIPGKRPILGGWSLGINATSRMKESAFSFISWVTGRKLAVPHTILGGATPSIRLYKSSELVGIYPWLPTVLKVFSSSKKRTISKAVTDGKISERQYESILGEAVHKAVTGELKAEEALRRADKELSSLLNRL